MIGELPGGIFHPVPGRQTFASLNRCRYIEGVTFLLPEENHGITRFNRGDGVGFDVLSFDEEDDSEQWIEVKTTTYGKYVPFYVSANEVRCSEAEAERYHVYRLFTFRKQPRLYVLHGAISGNCHLDAVQFRAVP